MKGMKDNFQFWILLILSLALAMFMGCDSGKKTIDQVTGNEAVKQFEKSKEKIDDVVDKQTERLNTVDEDDSDDEMGDENSEEADEE
jgi:hypothetical protein